LAEGNEVPVHETIVLDQLRSQISKKQTDGRKRKKTDEYIKIIIIIIIIGGAVLCP
jgi:hypothetical protein